MVQVPSKPTAKSAVIYPDSDGQPMADNTKQFRWIVTIQQNLAWMFADDPTVFVAGDLLWYPVEGDNKTRVAPDVMVAIGRPKGDRGSYKQWQEDNIAPQVVFEILSPGNTRAEMNRKLLFYNQYSVEEYYLYDPDKDILNGWLRKDQFLDVIDPIHDWVSPRLQIQFDASTAPLRIFRPDGKPFLSYIEIAQKAEAERQKAETERQKAEAERQKAQVERQKAEAERQKAETERQKAEEASQRADLAEQRANKLAAKLKALGIAPDES